MWGFALESLDALNRSELEESRHLTEPMSFLLGNRIQQ